MSKKWLLRKLPVFLPDSTHENAGAVRLRNMSSASDLPSDRRRSPKPVKASTTDGPMSGGQV